MFEFLKPFQKILVTGPQRSGTTICAVMIADELGYVYYPEEKVNVSNLNKMLALFSNEIGFVLQCPALCRYAHEVSSSETAVILMRRSSETIIKSEQRINWSHTPIELARYGLTTGVISDVKYKFWEDHQKPLIQNAFEVGYESLSSHPLWIPKERRINFTARQIQE